MFTKTGSEKVRADYQTKFIKVAFTLGETQRAHSNQPIAAFEWIEPAEERRVASGMGGANFSIQSMVAV